LASQQGANLLSTKIDDAINFDEVTEKLGEYKVLFEKDKNDLNDLQTKYGLQELELKEEKRKYEEMITNFNESLGENLEDVTKIILYSKNLKTDLTELQKKF